MIIQSGRFDTKDALLQRREEAKDNFGTAGREGKKLFSDNTRLTLELWNRAIGGAFGLPERAGRCRRQMPARARRANVARTPAKYQIQFWPGPRRTVSAEGGPISPAVIIS